MAIALYARKSIERENSISCETQIEYCKAMIKPDERSEQVLTFIDNGFSGGNINRDGFQKMLRKIEQGKIQKVIVYRLDRISRSLSDFVSILNIFKEFFLIVSNSAIDKTLFLYNCIYSSKIEFSNINSSSVLIVTSSPF